MPLTFSIVTPSFNQAAYIRATIDSVLSQDYPHLDYFIQDGGSTDATVEVLRSYGEKIRWASEKDAGQSHAINRGFAKTRGEVLGWLNSDDTFAPGALREAADFLHSHPDVAMVYGDADFIDARGNFIRRCAHIEPWNFHRLLNYSDFIVQPAAFFRRSAFDAVGGLDADLHYAMDYDLWLKIGRRFKVAYIPRLWAHYRWVGENKSAVGGRQRLDEVRRVAARHGRRSLPGYFRLEEVYLNAAEARSHLQQRDFPQAARRLLAAGASAASFHALKSLLQPRTWRVIHTGQVLRKER